MIRLPLRLRSVRSPFALAFVLAATQFATAADEPKKKDEPKKTVAITLDEVDADFALQGEYTGNILKPEGIKKTGAHVVALGGGKFRVVGYPGGLPGDGWTQEKRIQAEGELKDGSVTFTTEMGRGLLKGDTLYVQTTDGIDVGQLKKVQRQSPTLGKKPPEGAIVLFGGADANDFKGSQVTPDGLLQQGATSQKKFQDAHVHVEFLLSYIPDARGQERANSGCYLQGRYEVQILDSFGLDGKNNECGGIYEISDPSPNMCFAPLTWQTYDIDYVAAKFDAEGKKTADARITVSHNGVVVQKDVALPKGTRAAPVKEGPEPGPLYFQNHGNPIRFRNVWLVEGK